MTYRPILKKTGQLNVPTGISPITSSSALQSREPLRTKQQMSTPLLRGGVQHNIPLLDSKYLSKNAGNENEPPVGENNTKPKEIYGSKAKNSSTPYVVSSAYFKES